MSLINEALKKAQQVQTESETVSVAVKPSPSSLSSTPSTIPQGQSDIFKVLLWVMIFTIIIASFIAFLVISIMDRNSEGGQIVVVPQQTEMVSPAEQFPSTKNTAEVPSPALFDNKSGGLPSISFKTPLNDESSSASAATPQSSDTISDSNTPSLSQKTGDVKKTSVVVVTTKTGPLEKLVWDT